MSKPKHQIVLTVTPFGQFALIQCEAGVPAHTAFSVTLHPKGMFEELGDWLDPSSHAVILLLRVICDHNSGPACVRFSFNDADLGHLHFLPPVFHPQVFCHQDACQRWGVELRGQVSRPFALPMEDQAGE